LRGNRFINMIQEQRKIWDMWEEKAKVNGTALGLTYRDLNIRKMEIETISRCLRPGTVMLDAGCGNGTAIKSYARRRPRKIVGIDFSPTMIRNARVVLRDEMKKGNIDLRVGDVTDLQLEDESVDTVVSTRCLINLANKDLQRKAIREFARVLKRGGTYLMLESSIQGLDAINSLRVKFGLKRIVSPWHDLNFDERELLPFLRRSFKVLELRKFGTFFFLTRLVHPLMVYPKEPQYDARINEVARDLQLGLDEDYFDGLGHLFFAKLQKKPA